MKIITYLIAFVFAVSSLMSADAAKSAGLAGSPCVKSGLQTASTSGSYIITYKCVRTGKKLAWVQVSKKLAPKKAASQEIPDRTSFENLPTSLVPQIDRKILYALAAQAPSPSFAINFYTGPSISQTSLTSATTGLTKLAGLLGRSWNPKMLNAVIFSQNDANWIDQAMVVAGGNRLMQPSQIPYSEYLKTLTDCNFGNAGASEKGLILSFCIDAFNPNNLYISQLAVHEFFHTYQFDVGGYDLPQWLIEGGATFVGAHLGNYPTDKTFAGRSFQIKRIMTEPNNLTDATKKAIESGDLAGVVEALKVTESHNPPWANLKDAYYLGLLCSEVLVAVGGWDKYLELYALTKRRGFGQAFADTYGLTLSDFYPKAAKYIIDSSK